MNVIKNEKGTFVELPRESITFCGNTEEEKKANELIFDLSLENDRQQQELERYKNIIDKTINFIESMEYCGQEDYFYDEQALDPCGNDNTFEQSKTKLLDILKGE